VVDDLGCLAPGRPPEQMAAHRGDRLRDCGATIRRQLWMGRLLPVVRCG
jgi:hypothetical protein